MCQMWERSIMSMDGDMAMWGMPNRDRQEEKRENEGDVYNRKWNLKQRKIQTYSLIR